MSVPTFDGLLRDAASTGARLPGLAALMRRTLNRSGSHQLATTVLLSELPSPGETIAEAAADGLERFTMVDDVAIFEADSTNGPFLVSLWPSGFDSVWHAVSVIPATDPRWSKFHGWVRRAAPLVSPVYLDEQIIPDVCQALGQHGAVQASRMAARITFDGSSYNRGWKEDGPVSRPHWTEAIEEVADRGTVRTLAVTVENRLSVHIRREAGATYTGGDPDLFTDVALHLIAKAASEKVALFRDRHRRRREPLPPPIEIRLREGHLADVGQLQEVVRVLDDVAGLGIAVLHGNPYLHVAVTDYRDGSNCDLVVSSDARIALYPGFRASLGSLARISDAIAKDFAAVAVTHQPDRTLTSDDFFAAT